MTRMRSIQVAAATIAVAVIVAVLVSREPALRHPPGTPSPVVADPTGPAATGASSKVGYTAIRSESGTPADLPPIELPFRLALDELQARAKAGDPSARCRLAAEHAYCDDIRSALASVDGSLERQQARIARMEGEARQPKVAARTA